MTDKERIEIRKLRTQGIMPTEISKITGIKLDMVRSGRVLHSQSNLISKGIKIWCLNQLNVWIVVRHLLPLKERKIKSFVVINAGINIGILI